MMMLSILPPDLMIVMVLFLAVVFQIKHFLADYPLQNGYMLKKFLPGWGFFLPLVAHCAVHAGFTLAIVVGFGASQLWWLALVDFCVHFLMDRIKAGPKYMGRWKALSPNDFKYHFAVLKSTAVSGREGQVNKVKEESKRLIRGNTLHWNALGIDQMVHHVTHYYIIWKLLTL